MTLFHRPLSSADGFIQPEKPREQSRHHRYCHQKRICIGLNCRHCSPFEHRDHAMKYRLRHSKCLSDRVLKGLPCTKYSKSPNRRPSALSANSDLCQAIGRPGIGSTRLIRFSVCFCALVAQRAVPFHPDPGRPDALFRPDRQPGGGMPAASLTYLQAHPAEKRKRPKYRSSE